MTTRFDILKAVTNYHTIEGTLYAPATCKFKVTTGSYYAEIIFHTINCLRTSVCVDVSFHSFGGNMELFKDDGDTYAELAKDILKAVNGGEDAGILRVSVLGEYGKHSL